MNYIEMLLSNWQNVIITICALLFACQIIIKAYTEVRGFFGLETKQSLRRIKDQHLLDEHENKMNIIISGNAQNSKDIKVTNDKINVLSQMILDMQEKSDISERAQLKDRLTQIYRYHKEKVENGNKKEWGELEADAFWDMYSDYVERGGNHFIKTVVEPYMRDFRVIEIGE